VLSGAGDEGRARRALRSAGDLLVRERDALVLLLAPPFDGSETDPGYIRAYPQGVRENGGQYTHAAAWLGWAHALLGDADEAERILRLLNPIHHDRRYLLEPYVLAGDVYGAPPYVGRGGWSWYTGAAAWTWRLGVERILGLRREGGALRVDPCIPRDWPSFEAWVRSDGTTLHVVVTNPEHVSRGIAEVTIDGVPRDATRPLLVGTGAREVRVRLGQASAARTASLRAAI
jgi:cyclic beta-1,2-glucan synthetase